MAKYMIPAGKMVSGPIKLDTKQYFLFFSVRHRHRTTSGFTLIEIVAVLVIVGVLGSISVPAIKNIILQAEIKTCVAQLRSIAAVIDQHYIKHGDYPQSLADVGKNQEKDPWGNSLQYLKIQGGGPGIPGKARKNQFQVPLNDDYDLYSKGPDGQSSAPLTALPSRDDIIRANNGGFIGPASDY